MLQADKQVPHQRMMPLTSMQQRVTVFTAIPILYKLLHLHLCHKLEFNLRYFGTTTAFLTNHNVAGNSTMYSAASYVFLISSCFSFIVHTNAETI